MKIFISWSGNLSRVVATELRTWLNSVIQATDPWMSQEDIPTGSLWFEEIDESIKQSRYGILCITRENKNAPWLLWEAGALYAGFNNVQRVVPMLIDLERDDLGPPLSKFQALRATDRKNMLHMLSGINGISSTKISQRNLEKQLTLYWDEWQDAVQAAVNKYPHVAASESSCEYTFKDAADKFIKVKRGQNRSVRRYEDALKYPRYYIEHLPLDQVDNESLRQFIEDRQAGTISVPEGEKVPKRSMPRTINKDLQTVEAVLKEAALEWGWIPYAPKIKRIPLRGERRPYILSWDEQDRLFAALPKYVKAPALFAVNTGVRRRIIHDLEWAWLKKIPELDIPVFVVPPGYRRSKYGRTILLNSIAKSVLKSRPDKDRRKYVFSGKRGGQFTFGKAWKTAWEKAGLPTGHGYAKGVDNLKRTFERRLKDAGVSPEDRELLLWVSRVLNEHIDEPPDYKHLLAQLEKITERQDKAIVNL